jgi:3-deoxy-D-manno-octulosonic acid (KDO) 8-phosphate synthase
LDPLFLNDDQKKNAKTGTSVYELIQGITHFASHDNGFKVNDYDRRVLQVNAANLLTKKSFDMANQVLSPFN